MALIAEVEVPITVLCLGRVAHIEDVTIEFEPVVPIGDLPIRYIWVWGDSATEFGSKAEALPELTEVSMLEHVPNGALYQVVWHPPPHSFFAGLQQFDIALLSCISTTTSWVIRLRVHSHTSLGDLRTYCVSNQIDLGVVRLVSVEDDEAPAADKLTPMQREALLLAFEHGYFDDHRRTSLDELGNELGISRQAVAARLRRAYRNLAETVLEETPREERIT